jgi:hypothetical protein
MIAPRVRLGLSILFLALAAGCTKSEPEALPVGKPVFSFDYEAVRELLISRNEPSAEPWTARYAQNGWLGPQQVTPKWIIQQAPESITASDALADGSFLRHLLDSLRGLRKVSSTLNGDDSSFGLLPAWTRLEWVDGKRRFEVLLGAPVATGGRYARIGNERLVVNGAALDMISMMPAFQKTRHQKLMTWALDDADRVNIRWMRPKTAWAAERSSGAWAPVGGTTNTRGFGAAAEAALEAIAHLQIEQFDLSTSSFTRPEITIEWLDRKENKLVVEIDSELRARSSDRPGSIFLLHSGARRLLAPSGFPR